ncbi:MAG: hypothetical protein R6X29_08080 [Acidimicrobiia bacterium]|jgi:hypothetical protein
MSDAPELDTKGPRMVLWGTGIALGLLAVVALVLGTRPGPTLDPATPEGTVQIYAQAVIDGDEETARSLLDPETLERCEDRLFWDGEVRMRVAIGDSTITGDEARVVVTVTQSYGEGPFDGGQWSNTESFRLRMVDGSWRVRSGPYQLVPCSEVLR